MKRLLIALALVAAVVVVVLLVSDDGEADGYKVRAVFDNGAFMVTGEVSKRSAVRVYVDFEACARLPRGSFVSH